MSSSWTFGRIGLATSAGGDGLELPPHLPPRWDGDELTLVCDLPAATVADQVVLRDQFLGYDLNPDEPVVPITSVEVPSLDGFYRVQEVNVDDRLGTFIEGGEGSLVTVVARKVPGFTAPLFEVRCDGTDRINSHALTGNGWVAIPDDSLSRSYPTATADTLAAVTTDSYFIEADALYDASVHFSATPANHYGAAAFLSVDDRVVTGTQVANDTGWEIYNGLVRVKGAANANQITVGIRNAGATDYDDKDYRFGYFITEALEIGYDGTTRNPWSAPTVLRNSPECVSLRLYMAVNGVYQFDGGGGVGDLGYTSAYLDLTVRRGAFWLEARFVNDAGDGTTSKFGVWRSATEAGTSITGGIEATSADVSSNKYRIYTPVTRTADTTYGGLYATSARADLPFAIGNNRTFGSFTVANGYFAAMNHKQRIVSR